MTPSIRSATPDDLPFLRDMLMEAAYWRPGDPRPPKDEALAHPELAKLLKDWGREGDTGVIAVTEEGVPIGAAWYRFWTDANHSYGYVDAQTPELAIGVHADHRGQGIGHALMTALLDHARAQGIPQISLSVEKDNPAQNLYRRHGFSEIDTVENAWTMVAPLPNQ